MEKNKKKKIIIIAMIVIGVILIGILAYLLFIKKDDNNNSKNENIVDDNNKETLPKEGIIYKTKNGDKALKVFNISDDIVKRYSTIDLSEYLYLGEYNGQLIVVDKKDVVDNYVIYSGKLIDCIDCYESCYFIVKNNELLNLKYNLNIPINSDVDDSCYYLVKHIGNKYYVIKNDFGEVYDENANKLYDKYLGSDDKGNFYVLEKNNIKKINYNGELVKTGKYNIIYSHHVQNLITDDNLYTIVIFEGKTVFYDFINDKIYELGSSKKYSLCTENDAYSCGVMASLERVNDKIIIEVYDNKNENVKYIFDVKANKIEFVPDAKMIINENNQEIPFNNNKIKIKVVNSNLYINDKNIGQLQYNDNGIFVSDKLILIYNTDTLCKEGYFYKAINQEYKLIDIINNTDVSSIVPYTKDKEIYGIGYSCVTDCAMEPNGVCPNYIIHFVYDGNKVKVEEIN